ncbi:hypothetical protein [Hymenobacter sp.]|uniref:hypothetical protein n=1 Tax=Hymenobacter sp. TaxID=1898978 RepID=UPI00286A4088|nr:hypothetical protein [Hymenobacter sp.]
MALLGLFTGGKSGRNGRRSQHHQVFRQRLRYTRLAGRRGALQQRFQRSRVAHQHAAE